MGRTDVLLDLVHTHNVAAASTLIVLMVVGRAFIRDRKSAWLVALFALFAAALGCVFTLLNG